MGDWYLTVGTQGETFTTAMVLVEVGFEEIETAGWGTG
jgi:hypothetical protein